MADILNTTENAQHVNGNGDSVCGEKQVLGEHEDGETRNSQGSGDKNVCGEKQVASKQDGEKEVVENHNSETSCDKNGSEFTEERPEIEKNMPKEQGGLSEEKSEKPRIENEHQPKEIEDDFAERMGNDADNIPKDKGGSNTETIPQVSNEPMETDNTENNTVGNNTTPHDITISSVTSLSPDSVDFDQETPGVSKETKEVDSNRTVEGDHPKTGSDSTSSTECTQRDKVSEKSTKEVDPSSNTMATDKISDNDKTVSTEVTRRSSDANPVSKDAAPSSRSNADDVSSKTDSPATSGNGDVMCLPTDTELMREMYSQAGDEATDKESPKKGVQQGTGGKAKVKDKSPKKGKKRRKMNDESSEESDDDLSDAEEDESIRQLREKASMMLDIFNSLADHQQLEGLDVFQGIVNGVVKKITQGRVKSVKFVPVEDCDDEPPPEGDEQDDEDDNDTSMDVEEAEDSTIGSRRHPRVAAETSRLRTMGQVVVGEDGEVWVKEEPTSDDEDPSPDFNLDAGEEDEEDDDDYEEDEGLEEEYEPKKKKKKTNITRGSKSGSKSPRNIGERFGFRCRHCRYSAPTKSDLELHQIVHSKDRLFQCNICNKLFTAMASLKRHKMAHEGIKPHTCPICNKTFIDVASLRTHAVVHTGERLFKCDKCPKQYTNSANLSRHKRIHTGEMPYGCEVCGVRYRDLSSLKLHLLKHTGEKPYKCEDCGKDFKTSSDLRRHERTHTQERNYACKICNKTFIQGWHVKQHMRMHEDARPWQCERKDCGKSFRTKSSLQHHEKGHAGIKDYKCAICNKSFSTKKYLFDHQVIHTDAKPFKCKTCGQDFNQMSNLRRHERMHSDVSHYKCKYCGKAFKYINSWRYHEGIHKNEMTQCTKCGLYFRSKNGLKNHKCDPSKYAENIEKPPPAPKEIKQVKERRPTLVRRTRIRQFEPVVQLEKLDAKKLKKTKKSGLDPSEINSSGSEKCYRNLKKEPMDGTDPKMILLKQLTQLQKTGPKPLMDVQAAAATTSASAGASPVLSKKTKTKTKIKTKTKTKAPVQKKKVTKVVKVVKVKKGKSPAQKTKQKAMKIAKIKLKLPKKKTKEPAKKATGKGTGTGKPRGRPKGSKNKVPSVKKTKKTKKSKGAPLDSPEIVIKTEADPWLEQPLEPVMLTANMAAVQNVLNQNIEVKVEMPQDEGQTPSLVVCQVQSMAAGNEAVSAPGNVADSISSGEGNNNSMATPSGERDNNPREPSDEGQSNQTESSAYPADPVFEDLGIEVEMNWSDKSNSASPTKLANVTETSAKESSAEETSEAPPDDLNVNLTTSSEINNDELGNKTQENPDGQSDNL